MLGAFRRYFWLVISMVESVVWDDEIPVRFGDEPFFFPVGGALVYVIVRRLVCDL